LTTPIIVHSIAEKPEKEKVHLTSDKVIKDVVFTKKCRKA